MIKIRRYGKIVTVKFEDGKWTQVDSQSILNKGYGITYLTDWFATLFGKLSPWTKLLNSISLP